MEICGSCFQIVFHVQIQENLDAKMSAHWRHEFLRKSWQVGPEFAALRGSQGDSEGFPCLYVYGEK